MDILGRGYQILPGPLLWNIWSRRTTMVICEFGDWFFLKAIEADLRIGPLARLGQAQDAWN